MKGRAILFGLNYANDADASLQGCINDVNNMARYLTDHVHIPCDVYTDDITPNDTTFNGMIARLIDVALQSHTDDLDLVWVHYSGHGCYEPDRSGDELDRRDECLVPSDFRTGRVIVDDLLNVLLRRFNPRTRVVCVFDCCHSGTIADVKYSWESDRRVTIENIMCGVRAKVITLSGCMDDQTSEDAFDVLGDKRFSGAMTSCLLALLSTAGGTAASSSSGTPGVDVFALLVGLRAKLSERGFTQRPKLCSTYNLAKDRSFLPPLSA